VGERYEARFGVVGLDLVVSPSVLPSTVMYVEGDVRRLFNGLDIFGSFVNLDHVMVVKCDLKNVVDVVAASKCDGDALSQHASHLGMKQ